MKFSPLYCYLVPLRPKYSPQHPILKHPHPTFLPECKWPSFTPTQNNMHNYSSVYLWIANWNTIQLLVSILVHLQVRSYSTVSGLSIQYCNTKLCNTGSRQYVAVQLCVTVRLKYWIVEIKMLKYN
jgi:hypothetical protein